MSETRNLFGMSVIGAALTIVVGHASLVPPAVAAGTQAMLKQEAKTTGDAERTRGIGPGVTGIEKNVSMAIAAGAPIEGTVRYHAEDASDFAAEDDPEMAIVELELKAVERIPRRPSRLLDSTSP